MICPICKGELSIPIGAERCAEAYGDSLIVATECCGHGVIVKRVISLRVVPYTGDSKEDQWRGTPMKVLPGSYFTKHKDYFHCPKCKSKGSQPNGDGCDFCKVNF